MTVGTVRLIMISNINGRLYNNFAGMRGTLNMGVRVEASLIVR